MMSEERLSDRAFVLTVAALILLTPPIVTIFDLPVFVHGIPLLHIYCFAVWLAAIALGGYLATRVTTDGPDFRRHDDAPPEAESGS
jgi:hypothetical protein